jgi:hypothetical protein
MRRQKAKIRRDEQEFLEVAECELLLSTESVIIATIGG